jgi:hypothetical protein
MKQHILLILVFLSGAIMSFVFFYGPSNTSNAEYVLDMSTVDIIQDDHDQLSTQAD